MFVELILVVEGLMTILTFEGFVKVASEYVRLIVPEEVQAVNICLNVIHNRQY